MKEGDTAKDLIKQIKKIDPYFNEEIAKLYLILTNSDRKIKPCCIPLRSGVNFITLVYQLEHYKEPLIPVLVFEGMDIFDIADALKELRIIKNSRDFVIYALKNRLEGFLFPDTYLFSHNTKVKEIANKMTENFNKKAKPILSQATLLTPYKTLILASIIQKEARAKEEMPIIASVFYNRLKRGMPLQADPTVIYALKLKYGKNIRRAPTRNDLDIDSPYNTYKNRNLPPTPICNPGIDAIKAAVYPAKTDYLYFVATGSGKHAFARTLKEHIKNINRYR